MREKTGRKQIIRLESVLNMLYNNGGRKRYLCGAMSKVSWFLNEWAELPILRMGKECYHEMQIQGIIDTEV